MPATLAHHLLSIDHAHAVQELVQKLVLKLVLKLVFSDFLRICTTTRHIDQRSFCSHLGPLYASNSSSSLALNRSCACSTGTCPKTCTGTCPKTCLFRFS